MSLKQCRLVFWFGNLKTRNFKSTQDSVSTLFVLFADAVCSFRGQLSHSRLQPYVDKLQVCMDVSMGFPKGPTQILDFLYIGRKEDAMHIPLLARLGITHIINCVSR